MTLICVPVVRLVDFVSTQGELPEILFSSICSCCWFTECWITSKLVVIDEARGLQSIQMGNEGDRKRELHEYEDMQTSGSSLTPIKCSFTVPGVLTKDLFLKKKEKEIWWAWKGMKAPSLLHFPVYLLKPHASKECFVSSKLLNWVLRVEQIWCGTCPWCFKRTAMKN